MGSETGFFAKILRYIPLIRKKPGFFGGSA